MMLHFIQLDGKSTESERYPTSHIPSTSAQNPDSFSHGVASLQLHF